MLQNLSALDIGKRKLEIPVPNETRKWSEKVVQDIGRKWIKLTKK